MAPRAGGHLIHFGLYWQVLEISHQFMSAIREYHRLKGHKHGF